MNHFVKDISIKNFKSIQNIEIKDCSRINIFIGEPNVGKSNILEALSIVGLPYNYLDNPAYLNECVRPHENIDLFYNGNLDKKLSIRAWDENNSGIGFDNTDNLSFIFSIGKEGSAIHLGRFSFNGKKEHKDFPIFIEKIKNDLIFPIKKYHFLHNLSHTNGLSSTLTPPFGKNLPTILAQNKPLMKEIQEFFVKYGQKLVLDRNDNSLRMLKSVDTDDSFVFLLPYSSVADSLQRLIFYKAAVASNENAILLFEEPEAHTFPPYISKLTYDIIQSTTNQFFITTHSPVIVNDFLENAQADLSVFIVDFKNNQTVVHKLTAEEIHRVYQYGIDLFYNYENFVGA